jgi:hypothetical protein
MYGQMFRCDANLMQFRTFAGIGLCVYPRGVKKANKLAHAFLSPVDRQS